ncbi:MAG: plasmid pRiA4b ORF-3 family protein [Clostridiales Family XIII bacterium]|jgi:hypothetical protein|nr:plasmid pRiA4b ORF-3 family protein [Clostridiales Family XIII bacterium]
MNAYQFRITLKGTEPPIWRRVVVPSGISFDELHDIFNDAMGWSGCNSFSFRFQGSDEAIAGAAGEGAGSGGPLPGGARAADDTAIDGFVESALRDGAWFSYAHGNGWEYRVDTEKRIEGRENAWPEVTGADGECPPEGCGGPDAYRDFLAAWSDASNPEHERMRAWGEGQMYGGYDMAAVNEAFRAAYGGADAAGGAPRHIGRIVHIDGGEPGAPRSLYSVLNRFAKQDLKNNLKNLGIEEDASARSKSELIKTIAEFILDRNTAYACLINGFDSEIELLKRCIGQDQPADPNSPGDFIYFAKCGYCYLSKDSRLIMPEEVARMAEQLLDGEFERKRRRYRLVRNYISAAANLYAFISPEYLIELFNHHNEQKTDTEELFDVYYWMRFRCPDVAIFDGNLMDIGIAESENAEATYRLLLEKQDGKPYYLPPIDEFMKYVDRGYFERTAEMEALKGLLTAHCRINPDVADDMIAEIRRSVHSGADMGELFEILEAEGIDTAGAMRAELEGLLSGVRDSTRTPGDRGYTAAEMFRMEHRGES